MMVAVASTETPTETAAVVSVAHARNALEEVLDLYLVLEGVTPYLMANPAHMDDDKSTMQGTRKKVYVPEEEARLLEYRMPDGRLYVPAAQVHAASIEGGKRIKLKGSRSNMSAQVCAALGFTEEEFPLQDADGQFVHEYVVDRRFVRVNGAGVMRSRPMIPTPWFVTCHFELDISLVGVEEVGDILAVAGKRCGIGDYRPQKKGRFGKFRVVNVLAKAQ